MKHTEGAAACPALCRSPRSSPAMRTVPGCWRAGQRSPRSVLPGCLRLLTVARSRSCCEVPVLPLEQGYRLRIQGVCTCVCRIRHSLKWPRPPQCGRISCTGRSGWQRFRSGEGDAHAAYWHWLLLWDSRPTGALPTPELPPPRILCIGCATECWPIPACDRWIVN